MKTSTTARSCSSSTLKAARPWRLAASPRSPRTCSATAVEEKASPTPMTMAAGAERWLTVMPTAAMATVVASTW